MPFLNVIKNFANSEKAVAAGLLVVIATVFVFTGRITVQEWMDYTKVLLGIYVAGKTVQGAAAHLGAGRTVMTTLEKQDTDINDLLATVFGEDEDEAETESADDAGEEQ